MVTTAVAAEYPPHRWICNGIVIAEGILKFGTNFSSLTTFFLLPKLTV